MMLSHHSRTKTPAQFITKDYIMLLNCLLPRQQPRCRVRNLALLLAAISDRFYSVERTHA
jgi:hypothetical protein